MNQPLVTVSKDNGIATVTLNRPEKLNALNREMRGMFCSAMQELGADPATAVVIITGAGRAFSAGLDLNELGVEGIRESGGVTFISVVERMEAPVIAAVNGYAVTGGFELALACDIIIAAETAQFADTHARVGVMPGGGMSARLPRAVGVRKAKELSLTGNYLNARDAERLGLVNRCITASLDQNSLLVNPRLASRPILRYPLIAVKPRTRGDFAHLSRECRRLKTRWRSEGDSNPRCR
jgi:enoyl-CoA hydratase